MLKVIFLATLFISSANAIAAQTAQRDAHSLKQPDEFFRVDPGKTLQLIKRIKEAGGRHVAS